MPKLRYPLFLVCAVAALCLWQEASADARFGRFGGHGFGHGFGGPGGPGGAGRFGHGAGPGGMPRGGGPGGGGPGGGHQFSHGFSHGLSHGPGGFGHDGREGGHQQFSGPGFRGGAMARNGLPRRPFPGEPGFTGVPPQGETRFVSREMVVHVPPGVSAEALDASARRLGLTAIGSQDLALSGGRMVHFRVRGDVNDAIRGLEADRIGIAQPNYVYELQDNTVRAAAASQGDPAQYVIDKLHLREAHGLATGANVTVAVIDTLIDATHPDLAGSIATQYDAVAPADHPDEHGTGMTGAIAAHRRLLGVAPGARILAVHAFSPPKSATTQSIVVGIDWAVANGAKIINMSFAGPYDPMLQLALKKARDKGVVLIAAAGNNGPQSPPQYPAADENVIAVTAVDDRDNLMPQANRGAHVALAAPGVNVLEAVPRGTYNYTTGTSVAAAHVSGVAALILERSPGIDVASLEDVLFSTARDLGAPGRDPQFGFGLVDPYRALQAVDNKTIANRRTPETTAQANGQYTGAPGGERAGIGGDTSPRGPLTPAALPRPVDEAAVLEMRREACQKAGADRGVADADIADYVNLCVSEARVACLKQAVVRKVPAPERRDFMNRCLKGS